MATIITKTDLVRRAIEFIVEEKKSGTQKTDMMLIDEASMRFNLSPVESESLLRLLTTDATI